MHTRNRVIQREGHELSIAVFSMRTKIYLLSEVRTESYLEFIASCIRTTKGFKDDTYWPTIANGTYNKGTAQEKEIMSPIHCLLHRLITNTINQR